MRFILPALLLSLTTALAREPITHTWDVDGVKREALLYIPGKVEKTRPLVFVFHGHGGTSKGFAEKCPIHQHWPNAIVVYPQGLPTASKTDPMGKKPGWQHGEGDLKDRDLKFFDTMLSWLTKHHDIDAKRIYATGHSNGGGFTYTLWAARGKTLAAVAPSSGGAGMGFAKLEPKPVLHLAGQKDTTVLFDRQEKTMQRLRELNRSEDKGKPAGKHCTEYASKDKDGFPVVTFIHPGGHALPSAAAARFVEFFKAHRLK